MKALVGALNQEKAILGAFSVIVQLRRLIVCSSSSRRHSLAREDSKVVVTTIADLEFHDDHLSDRVALRSSKSGLTSSCSPENGKDISEFEGSPPSGYGSGESARILPHEFRQQQPGPGPGQQLGAAGSLFSDQQPYLMLQPPAPAPAPAPHTFYTLRKHPAPSAAAGPPQPPHRFSQAAAEVEHKLDSIAATTSNGGRQQPGSCAESAEEFVAAYREKQRAGFMYGTLRHAPPRHTCGGPAPAPAVVPPPPMFEEPGAANPKTPLIATKKGEKKDKMESRV